MASAYPEGSICSSSQPPKSIPRVHGSNIPPPIPELGESSEPTKIIITLTKEKQEMKAQFEAAAELMVLGHIQGYQPGVRRLLTWARSMLHHHSTNLQFVQTTTKWGSPVKNAKG